MMVLPSVPEMLQRILGSDFHKRPFRKPLLIWLPHHREVRSINSSSDHTVSDTPAAMAGEVSARLWTKFVEQILR